MSIRYILENAISNCEILLYEKYFAKIRALIVAKQKSWKMDYVALNNLCKLYSFSMIIKLHMFLKIFENVNNPNLMQQKLAHKQTNNMLDVK